MTWSATTSMPISTLRRASQPTRIRIRSGRLQRPRHARRRHRRCEGASPEIAGVAPGVKFSVSRLRLQRLGHGRRHARRDGARTKAWRAGHPQHVDRRRVNKWPQYPTALAARSWSIKGWSSWPRSATKARPASTRPALPASATRYRRRVVSTTAMFRLPGFTASPDDFPIAYTDSVGDRRRARAAPAADHRDGDARRDARRGCSRSRAAGTTAGTTAALPLPAGHFAGKVALIRRGTLYRSPSRPRTRRRLVQVRVVLYNNQAAGVDAAHPGASVSIPVVIVSAGCR